MYFIQEADDDGYFSDMIKELDEQHTLKEAVSSKSALPLTGNSNKDVRYVAAENEYYYWAQNPYGKGNSENPIPEGDWLFFCKMLNNKASTGTEYSIKAPALVPFLDTCRADIPCNSDDASEITNAGVRLAVLTKRNNIPVLADYNDDISFTLTGNNNLIDTLFKEYIEWKNNRYCEVTCVIRWPEHIINNFPWDKRFRINDSNYLVKKIPIKISHDNVITYGATELVRT
jgi:hypothetical protein